MQNLTTNEQMVFQVLYEKHKKIALCKKEMSSETGQSISTLDRLRKSGLGCGYIKENKGDVYYPLTELARYYCNKVIKTA
jgi:DNA-binding PadR family transcriptional regulator